MKGPWRGEVDKGWRGNGPGLEKAGREGAETTKAIKELRDRGDSRKDLQEPWGPLEPTKPPVKPHVFALW